jgi:hypothetical protein
MDGWMDGLLQQKTLEKYNIVSEKMFVEITRQLAYKIFPKCKWTFILFDNIRVFLFSISLRFEQK